MPICPAYRHRVEGPKKQAACAALSRQWLLSKLPKDDVSQALRQLRASAQLKLLLALSELAVGDWGTLLLAA